MTQRVKSTEAQATPRLRRPLTQEDLEAVRFSLHHRRPFKLVTKSSSPLMSAVGLVLDAFGITDKDRFMEDFTTTVWVPGTPQPVIYTPFTYGEAGDVSLVAQLIILCHEHKHVEQADELGVEVFSASYLGLWPARRKYEVDAYTVSMEMAFMLWGETPWETYVDSLKSYGLSKRQISHARKALKGRAQKIRNYELPLSRPAADARIVLMRRRAL